MFLSYIKIYLYILVERDATSFVKRKWQCIRKLHAYTYQFQDIVYLPQARDVQVQAQTARP